MQPYFDHIYLSPHLDDVALSCGGQIFLHTTAGQSVLVVTLMAGAPDADTAVSEFVQLLHQRWQLFGDAVTARRQEDLDACAILGAEAQHGPFPDSIYRFDPHSGAPYYPTRDAIFGAVHPQEAALVDGIAAWLRALPAAGQVYAPLTLGGHVDHQLTRLAAEGVYGRRLRYYEDYPYVQQDPAALDALLGPARAGWQAQVIPLTDAALQARGAAIAAFVSQVSSFFSDRADLQAQITAYAAMVGGERLWQPNAQLFM
jgi:LmbE family N-acetylglucosaminyl deacetylase